MRRRGWSREQRERIEAAREHARQSHGRVPPMPPLPPGMRLAFGDVVVVISHIETSQGETLPTYVFENPASGKQVRIPHGALEWLTRIGLARLV